MKFNATKQKIRVLLTLLFLCFTTTASWAQQQGGEMAASKLLAEINAIQFVSAESGQCAEVANQVANGQNVGQQPCIGFRRPRQNWSLEERGANIQIVVFQGANDLSNQCLEVTGGGAADGTNVRIATCSGVLFQQWTFEWVGNGHRLLAAHSGKCLQLSGDNLQQSTCSNASTQIWRLTPPNASYRVFPQHTIVPLGLLGRCIEKAGANLQQGTCDPIAERLWFFTPSNDGLQIQNIQSNLCAEVINFSTDDGANIQEAVCTGGTNQEWRLQPVSVGLGDETPVPFQIIPRHSNKCMDVSAVSQDVGTNIQQWVCLGATQLNQLWNTSLWNSFPFAQDDAVSMSTNQQASVAVAALGNDGDPDNDPICIISTTTPANGQVVIANDGKSATYTPNAGFVGIDAFSYTIRDGFADCTTFAGSGMATANATVTVNATSMAQLINGVDGARIDVALSNPAGQSTVTALNFLEATPLMNAVPAGNVTIEARVVGSNNAFASKTMTLDPAKSYVIFAGGTTANGALMVREAQAQAGASEIRVTLANAAADSPANGIRLNVLNDLNEFKASLSEGLQFGAVPTPYVPLEERNLNIQACSTNTACALGGPNEIGVYRFLLNGRLGETFTGVMAGSIASGKTGAAAPQLALFDVQGNSLGSVVTANEDEGEVPVRFALRGNYPNPFNPSTTIAFDLPSPAEVTIEVLDLMGRRVMLVQPQTLGAGANQQITVDASRLASGVYVYRVIAQMQAESLVQTGRMTLLK